jgi:hypothetical protein
MKRTTLAVLVAFGLAGCGIRTDGTPAVQGSGFNGSERRQTGEFSGVVLEGSANVAVKIGQPTTVIVEGDDNLLPLITTEVKEGRLVIGNRESYTTRLGIHVYVTTPQLEAAVLSGSGSIQTQQIESDEFEASIPGSGKMAIDELSADKVQARMPGSGALHVKRLACRALTASLDGSGTIEISGSADTVEASISGSGNLELAELTAKNAAVDISGSGRAEVQATNDLDAVISGSGSVYYSGNPKSVRKEVSGSGSVSVE